MMSVSRYLRREWEQVASAVATVVLLLFLADWALRDSTADALPGSGRIAESLSVLGPGAFAFLQEADPGSAPARNPFLSSAIEAPVARPEKPPRVEPPKAPAPVPQPPKPVAPRPTPPEPVRPPVAAAPAPRLGVCDVKYVFSSTNRSGRPVALIELQDAAQPGAAPLARNVSAGDQAFGLRIQSFTDEVLIVVDAVGRRQSVNFGATRRVTVNFGAAP